jgi:D-alanine-D-alanine ligase
VDLNVALRTFPRVAVSAIERPLRRDASGRIYSYADKYLMGGDGMMSAPRELPANVPDEIAKRLREAAVRVAEVAAVRGAPRIDFLWHGDDVWVNEINTIPGAMGFYFWQAEGVAPEALLADLLAEAAQGPTRRYTTDGADGSALRAAGSIAGKLA